MLYSSLGTFSVAVTCCRHPAEIQLNTNECTYNIWALTAHWQVSKEMCCHMSNASTLQNYTISHGWAWGQQCWGQGYGCRTVSSEDLSKLSLATFAKLMQIYICGMCQRLSLSAAKI